MYYDYSTDGGRTYSELQPWPDLDIMSGTYPDTFTFSLNFTKGEQPVITVRGYNQADLFTESASITFDKPFVDQEKAAKEALEASLAAEEAASLENASKDSTSDSIITMADAAGNNGIFQVLNDKKQVNFGVFLIICGILAALLLVIFLLYQIQLSRHKKRRRRNHNKNQNRNQSRNVSGDRSRHPR